jgi:hypothetical protein
MKKNVGSSDKILRIAVGIALIAFANFGPDTGYNAWGWFGIIPLGTAFLGICPAYLIFGIRTSKNANLEA